MIPEYYEFQSSAKVMSGRYALENIPSELENLGAEKPMVLSDEMLKKIGTLKIVLDALLGGGIEPGGIYTSIPPDSSLKVVHNIVKEYRRLGCDSLIAVGGGSVIDTAKGVRMVLSQNVEDLLDIWGCENMTGMNHIPFIAVPTTSGTGSESTLVAVIKNEARRLKMEFISYYLQPDAAVLDERMTETLPPRMTASTGMDALCHAIEAYTCIQKNPLSDAYAVGAIRLIADNLERAVANGKDRKARLAMANASMMAGAAFSNSMVGVIHAIGHALGGVCRVPHGDAMTILLPHGMAFNHRMRKEMYAELLLHLAGEEVFAKTPKSERGKEAIRSVWELRMRLHKECGLPVRLRECGVKKSDFAQIARTAMNDGAMIVNPRDVKFEDVIFILEKAF
ncbi:iron-containing alcohol dehydrogenase [Ruminococcus sp. OA3]|uniref:iron-containing alcohol dehydrogenase n=1 Tax=Ruminococcus sp. OA3 TaxID=2914164 RepID=UPI001F06DBC7|nr:iron-containing alcohol dehydrogenase [Ruminococcus sp. OA3]MCH1982516.1 iron-containing alcohol dehydrogenase [Ruminococcus sp. OA3]